MPENTAIVRRWLLKQYRENPPICRGLTPVIPLSVVISYLKQHNMIPFIRVESTLMTSTLATGSFPTSRRPFMVQFTEVKFGGKRFVIAC